MGYLEHLPREAAELIRGQYVSEYATVSAAGVPINTPTLIHTSPDLATLDMVTGLAYPAKADRARRNPKVGLLIERAADQPVILISGMAAVRDADLQANMDRCAAEAILFPFIAVNDYQAVTRHAVWYFTRMWIEITPARIRWWDTPAAMDRPPHEWRAPAGTVFPQSDPAPPGVGSKADWPTPVWQDLARQAMDRKGLAHLTLLDEEGFPLPIGARQVTLTDEGFELVMPKALPWTRGKATLSFAGLEIFIGEASQDDDIWRMKVERALPVMPLMADTKQVLNPNPENRAKLMSRLEYEANRRGQAIPAMPATPPEPTAGARMRDATAKSYVSKSGAPTPKV